MFEQLLSNKNKMLQWCTMLHNNSANADSGELNTVILPPFLDNCRYWYACRKFDSISRKYVQHLYLQINLLKN
jgi:hypothetical protein